MSEGSSGTRKRTFSMASPQHHHSMASPLHGIAAAWHRHSMASLQHRFSMALPQHGIATAWHRHSIASAWHRHNIASATASATAFWHSVAPTRFHLGANESSASADSRLSRRADDVAELSRESRAISPLRGRGLASCESRESRALDDDGGAVRTVAGASDASRASDTQMATARVHFQQLFGARRRRTPTARSSRRVTSERSG